MSEHFDASGNSIRDWAKALYPGGIATNLAGQAIRQPVYDDPASAHLYPPPIEECRFCGEPIAGSDCEGQDWHCAGCRDDGNCPACNGAPSVKS